MRWNLTFRRADGLLFHRVVVAIALLAIATLSAVEVANAQNPNGTPANGGRQFQYSVMIDGDVAIAGAEWHDGFKGAAYILRRRGTEWVVEQKLSPGDLGPYDHFGGSTSIGGDYIVVGAAWHGTFRGAAYVFKRVGGEWIQQQKLMASDAVPDGQFGKMVSVDGDVITVGAGSEDTRAVRTKTMYRFTRSGDRWDEREILIEPNLDRNTLQHEESSLNCAAINSLLAATGLIGNGAGPPALQEAPPPVDSVMVTDGTLEDRVEVRWPNVGLDAIVYKVLRNGVLLS
ncbi:MAG: FG-GAP repeat protein, partial [bacterium]